MKNNLKITVLKQLICLFVFSGFTFFCVEAMDRNSSRIEEARTQQSRAFSTLASCIKKLKRENSRLRSSPRNLDSLESRNKKLLAWAKGAESHKSALEELCSELRDKLRKSRSGRGSARKKATVRKKKRKKKLLWCCELPASTIDERGELALEDDRLRPAVIKLLNHMRRLKSEISEVDSLENSLDRVSGENAECYREETRSSLRNARFRASTRFVEVSRDSEILFREFLKMRERLIAENRELRVERDFCKERADRCEKELDESRKAISRYLKSTDDG